MLDNFIFIFCRPKEALAREREQQEAEKRVPHLMNLNEDLSLSGKLCHFCKLGRLRLFFIEIFLEFQFCEVLLASICILLPQTVLRLFSFYIKGG